MAQSQAHVGPDLFTPVEVGPLHLKNRVVMAPLTRSRAAKGNVPTALNALYYAQRASAGLIISEATQVSQQGQGYIATPGVHSAEQICGWSLVTKAVHVAGGHMVLQLWHVGRISHPSFQPCGGLPLAPSAIRPEAQAFNGKPFIANPDLAIRLLLDAPLMPVNRDTLYGGGEAGYTDYPMLRAVAPDTCFRDKERAWG
jgi:N-ethylmaleimide reductase